MCIDYYSLREARKFSFLFHTTMFYNYIAFENVITLKILSLTFWWNWKLVISFTIIRFLFTLHYYLRLWR